MSESELDFGDGSWEEAGSIVRSTLLALHRDMNGNGKPGIKEDVSEIKHTAKTSLLWMKGIAGALALLITGMGIWIAYLELNNKIAESQRHSQLSEDHTPQDAGNSPFFTETVR